MRILVISGSRADYGILQPVIAALKADPYFEVMQLMIWGHEFHEAAQFQSEETGLPDMVLLLGDRFEILAAAINCHLNRVHIAHIGGGDVSEGSYDDAMRDCITRLSSVHFVTSAQSEARVRLLMGQKNVHLVGNPAVDFIMGGDWKRERPIEESYVVVAYYPETIDDTVDLDAVNKAIAGRKAVWINANKDRGSERIPQGISLPHGEFLNLLYHCEEFIGNSSAIYYEAPFLGVKTREIGKRQKGRVIPWGDGQASKRIVKFLKEYRV